jgi:hypothetical protein
MSKLDDRIAAIEGRLKTLKAQRVRVVTRQRARDSRQERREDTRRKILVGAIVLAKVARGEIAQSQLAGWLEGALTRAEDRALFELEDAVGSS